jgi:hypothetical protein
VQASVWLSHFARHLSCVINAININGGSATEFCYQQRDCNLFTMNRILWPLIREVLLNANGSGEAHDLSAAGPSNGFYTPENTDFYAKISYAELDPRKKEFRLLKFLPRKSSEVIQCQLVDSLEHEKAKKHYKALSYCAGNPNQTRIIMVNGLAFNVFANLGHALDEVLGIWQATNGKDDLLLWVDQICIDQSNVEERSHQVGFMRDIYKFAEETFICLSTKQSDGAGIDWLRKAYDESEKLQTRHMQKALFEYIRKQINEPGFMAGLHGFFDILKSNWWTRAWIFQEFLSSDSLQLVFGRQYLPWSQCSRTFLHMLTILESSHNEVDLRRPDSWHIQTIPVAGFNIHSTDLQWSETMDVLHQLVHSEKLDDSLQRARFMANCKMSWSVDEMNLRILLNHSRRCSSSDPRDKIYAFLGCTSSNYSIVPDYSPAKSVRDLFMESARSIILQENNLAILHDAVWSTKTHSLPSWTPDWTSAVGGSFFYDVVHWSRLYWIERPPDFEESSVKFRDDPVFGLGSRLDVSGYCIKIWDHVSHAPGGPVRMTWIYEIKESYVVLASHEILAQDELWILPGTWTPLIFRKQASNFSLVGEAIFLKEDYEMSNLTVKHFSLSKRSQLDSLCMTSSEVLRSFSYGVEDQKIISIC